GLQGVQASALGARASGQQHGTIEIPAGRGTIYDRIGFPLAIGERARTVSANPREVADPRAVSIAAAQTLGVDPNKLHAQLVDKSKGFVYVARQVDPAKALALEKRGLAGLHFEDEERRAYPQGPVAAQVLGFAGIDYTGIAGIEKEYDGNLACKPWLETYGGDPVEGSADC